MFSLQDRDIRVNCRLKSGRIPLLMSLSLRHTSRHRTSYNKIGVKSFSKREPRKLSVPSAIKDPKAAKSLEVKDFIRKHILELAPYKSIVPFDVLSGLLDSVTFAKLTS